MDNHWSTLASHIDAAKQSVAQVREMELDQEEYHDLVQHIDDLIWFCRGTMFKVWRALQEADLDDDV